jgi:hypothetical protein
MISPLQATLSDGMMPNPQWCSIGVDFAGRGKGQNCKSANQKFKTEVCYEKIFFPFWCIGSTTQATPMDGA